MAGGRLDKHGVPDTAVDHLLQDVACLEENSPHVPRDLRGHAEGDKDQAHPDEHVGHQRYDKQYCVDADGGEHEDARQGGVEHEKQSVKRRPADAP